MTGADVSTIRASGSEKSVARSGSTTTSSQAVSTSSQFPSAGNSTTPPGAPPSTRPTVPDAVDVFGSTCTPPSIATPANRSPDASALRSLGSETTKVATAVVATGPGTNALAASSTIAHRSSMLPPAPPQSSGTATPKRPRPASPANTGRHASAFPSSKPYSMSRTAAVAAAPEAAVRAQPRTNSRAADCSSVTVATTCRPPRRQFHIAMERSCPLERVLIVLTINRQVEGNNSSTCRRLGCREVGNLHTACVSFANEPPGRGAARYMSSANTNTSSAPDAPPRAVMKVAVLAESELGSEAQQERRKRILDATMAIASKGGYEAVQMRAVADRADVAVGTLYRYFPSKVHLLVSALGREFSRIDAKTDRSAVAGATPSSG